MISQGVFPPSTASLAVQALNTMAAGVRPFTGANGLVRVACLLMFLACSTAMSMAQPIEDLGILVQRLAPAEIESLNAVVHGPVPAGALTSTLRTHFTDKQTAARKLGDQRIVVAVLREALLHRPDAAVKNNLANELKRQGEFAEAEELYKQAIAGEPQAANRALHLANLLDLMYQKGDFSRLEEDASSARKSMDALMRNPNMSLLRRSILFRAQANVARTQSSVNEHFGRHDRAIAHAQEAVRLSLQSESTLPPEADPIQQVNIADASSFSLRRQVSANMVAGRMPDAEKALQQYYDYVARRPISDGGTVAVFQLASQIRYQQQDFEGSLRYADQALSVARQAGLKFGDSVVAEMAWTRIRALTGMRRYADAIRMIEQSNELVTVDHPRLSAQAYWIDWSWILLESGNWDEAATQLERRYGEAVKRLGPDHFVTTASQGLLGVALWESGRAEQRGRAVELLSGSVVQYQKSAQLLDMDNQGIRERIRRRVFEIHLQTVSASDLQAAAKALGAADWLASSSVQTAVTDAAVRAAVTTPELSELVRAEQDIRNESQALRRYLAGESGVQAAASAQTAADTRVRLSQLEADRVALLSRIRAGFPDYDRLLRPPQAQVEELSKFLRPTQALLVLLPTSTHVCVWAMGREGQFAFHRAALTDADLDARVRRLRASVEFAPSGRPDQAFRLDDAYALYRDLLAPVEHVLRGKSEWIVASSGSLAQIPFGLLLKSEHGGAVEQAPWLAREVAFTYLPSASAWMQLRRIERRQLPTGRLAAWGDPQFDSRVESPKTSIAKRAVTIARASPVFDLPSGKSAPAVSYARIPALPETRDELLAIARALGADASKDLFLGDQATRRSVLTASSSGYLGSKRVIVFATHGLMAGDLPSLDQPALALAANNEEDGNPLSALLTLQDVLTLRLNADWVVLSACNTAAADGKAQVALSGLARGFLYAGARDLLVTHWAVESESAKLLTTAAFEYYAGNPDVPKAESLRRAMLKVMAMPAYGHPAYWAPFALIGNGGR